MIDQPTLTQAARDAADHVERQPRIVVDLEWPTAWSLLRTLQRALRQADCNGFDALEVRELIEWLKPRVAVTPALRALADAQEDPALDEMFAAAAADPRRH